MKKTLKNADLTLVSQLVLSLLIMIMGIIVMVYKSFGLIEIVLYISILFYILTCIGVIAYFVKRREKDYETLILALSSLITATFMFIFKANNAPLILGTGLTIFSLLEIFNRIYKIAKLKKEDNFMWIIKFIITFVIGVLGLLTSINLYKEITVQTMMIAYYFITFGFALSIENFIEIFITDKKFKIILAKLLDEDPYKHLDNIKEDRIKQIKESKKKTTKTKTSVNNKSKKTTAKK